MDSTQNVTPWGSVEKSLEVTIINFFYGICPVYIIKQTVNDGVAHFKIYTLDLTAWYLVWKESVGPNDAS